MAKRWKASDVEISATGTLRARTSTKTSMPLMRGGKGGYSGVILGIDPSLRGTGLAVLRYKGGQPKLVFSTTIKTKGNHTEALGQIAQTVANVCKQYSPDIAAIEETIYAQNQRTAITLGATRGAVLATLALHQITCEGYAPAKIKSAITGNGRASKQQVIGMTQALLSLPEALESSDEAVAVAAALCLGYALR